MLLFLHDEVSEKIVPVLGDVYHIRIRFAFFAFSSTLCFKLNDRTFNRHRQYREVDNLLLKQVVAKMKL